MICRQADGGWVLDYMYLNDPEFAVRHRSPIHHGSASIRLSGSPVRALTGRYWTDRDSKGIFEFVERSPNLADGFTAALGKF